MLTGFFIENVLQAAMSIYPQFPWEVPESAPKQMMRVKAQELRAGGASYPEIAEFLGVSLGATWNLLNKKQNAL